MYILYKYVFPLESPHFVGCASPFLAVNHQFLGKLALRHPTPSAPSDLWVSTGTWWKLGVAMGNHPTKLKFIAGNISYKWSFCWVAIRYKRRFIPGWSHENGNLYGKIHHNWKFIAGKIIELTGRFSSKPCLLTGGYHTNMLDGWFSYLHLGHFWGTCWQLY